MFRQQQRPASSATAASLTEDEAREILNTAGAWRRKRLRIRYGVQIGFFASLPVIVVLALLGMVSKGFVQAWLAFGAGPLFWIFFLSPRFHSFFASTQQKEALKTLLPHAQREDIVWLIEGSQYLGREALREHLQELLPQLSAHQAALLPEGARKILRTEVLHLYHPLAFRETVLGTLLLLDDVKTKRLVEKLARRKPLIPGEEALIIKARQSLGQDTSELMPLALTDTEARQVLQKFTQAGKRRGIYDLIVFVGFFALQIGGIALSSITHSALWILGAYVLTLLISVSWLLEFHRAKVPNLLRQTAYLRFVETANVSDLLLLREHLGCLRSLPHQELAFHRLTSLLHALTTTDQHLLPPKVREWLQHCVQQPQESDTPDWYRDFQAAARRVLESHP